MMGFKLKNGRLTLTKRAGAMKGYIAEPGTETRKKCYSYMKKSKEKKKLL